MPCTVGRAASRAVLPPQLAAVLLWLLNSQPSTINLFSARQSPTKSGHCPLAYDQAARTAPPISNYAGLGTPSLHSQPLGPSEPQRRHPRAGSRSLSNRSPAARNGGARLAKGNRIRCFTGPRKRFEPGRAAMSKHPGRPLFLACHLLRGNGLLLLGGSRGGFDLLLCRLLVNGLRRLVAHNQLSSIPTVYFPAG